MPRSHEERTAGIPAEAYERIARAIESGDSPVGIDAKLTHVWILHELEQIRRRLERLESRLTRPSSGPGG